MTINKDRRYGVVDMEHSECGDCACAKVCVRLQMIGELHDPIVPFRVVISECEGYVPPPLPY